eukprot:202075_1
MMSLRIAKFPLVFFVLLCTPGGVLLASDIPMPQDEPENTDLLNSPDGPSKLLDGYFRESYGIPVDLKLLSGYYAELIPRPLPAVTVTFRGKNAASDEIDVEMGELLEKFPNLRNSHFQLVYGSPKQADLRTTKDLSDWKINSDWPYKFGRLAANRHSQYYDEDHHAAGLENNSNVVNMSREFTKIWMLDTLTLLVCNGDDAVAYAKVNIDPVPLPRFGTTLVTNGDAKKLVVAGLSGFHFPYIPEEFKLYMVKGWPDIPTKESVDAFREWFRAKKPKIELEIIGDNTLFNRELKFDPKIDLESTFAPDEKITFVFEDSDVKKRSIIVFSESFWGSDLQKESH